MHCKLDENIPIQLGKLIRNVGFTFSSVYSEDISGITDKELLKVCLENKYILITLDKDFMNSPFSQHKGIIILRSYEQGIISIINLFESFLKNINLHQAEKSLIIVEKNNIRIRTE